MNPTAASSANTFSSLSPLFKEAYAGPMKTHQRPGKEERFKSLKAKLRSKKK